MSGQVPCGISICINMRWASSTLALALVSGALLKIYKCPSRAWRFFSLHLPEPPLYVFLNKIETLQPSLSPTWCHSSPCKRLRWLRLVKHPAFPLDGRPSAATGLPHGCYEGSLNICLSDSTSSRTLKIAAYTDVNNMTIESCIAFCTPAGYLYAGVEFARVSPIFVCSINIPEQNYFL